ncbi:MAG TPA: [FeFe] hydrogenase H-cluster maturation GTPase HydF, partial [Candidatus Goldiibacteriota bacterium]|nr:[FeFe] hydrogenase H-cluster maturation GTPase HydF [Candidatus Goldiibacteriota bacterium]
SDDIGRVKIPRWIRQYTGKNLEFDTVAGPYMDKDLSKYNLIISCGACMINRKELLSRIDSSKSASIPITNYGMAISFTQGVFERVVKPFKEL